MRDGDSDFGLLERYLFERWVAVWNCDIFYVLFRDGLIGKVAAKDGCSYQPKPENAQGGYLE